MHPAETRSRTQISDQCPVNLQGATSIHKQPGCIPRLLANIPLLPFPLGP